MVKRDENDKPIWEKTPEGKALGSYAVDHWYIPEDYEDHVMWKERLEATASLAKPEVVADAVFYCMEWAGMKPESAMMAVEKARKTMLVSCN